MAAVAACLLTIGFGTLSGTIAWPGQHAHSRVGLADVNGALFPSPTTDQGTTAGSGTTARSGSSSSCTAVSLDRKGRAEAPPGPTVTLSATAEGCPAPVYRFWEFDPGSRWRIVQDYGPASTYHWKAPATPGAYKFEVDVRDASETTVYDVVANLTYPVEGCSAVALAASRSSPQPHGTQVTLTGTATCPRTATYRFWVRAPGGKWQVIRDYATSDTATWTPGIAGTWSLEVDVRGQNSTTSYEAVFNQSYVVG
jgi:hypothetical protein